MFKESQMIANKLNREKLEWINTCNLYTVLGHQTTVATSPQWYKYPALMV